MVLILPPLTFGSADLSTLKATGSACLSREYIYIKCSTFSWALQARAELDFFSNCKNLIKFPCERKSQHKISARSDGRQKREFRAFLAPWHSALSALARDPSSRWSPPWPQLVWDSPASSARALGSQNRLLLHPPSLRE